jgi:hypothetical protein
MRTAAASSENRRLFPILGLTPCQFHELHAPPIFEDDPFYEQAAQPNRTSTEMYGKKGDNPAPIRGFSSISDNLPYLSNAAPHTHEL